MAEVTNYIDRLVAELCPDGVEYRPLGEIADVTSGYVFPVKYQGNEKSAEDNIPFYKVSDMNLPGNEMFMTSSNNYVSAESAKEMRASLAQPESIIFPKIGAAIATNKKRILTEKSIVDNNVMVVTARSVINSKFLYYVLTGFDLMSWSMGAGAVPSIKKSVVVKHEVPVPPLEIQEAIVEILDKFTNLEAELEAELEARTLQYEYYRDSLFEALDCPRVPLGSLGIRNKGITITASKMRTLEPGNKDVRIFAAGSTFIDTDSSFIPDKGILEGPAIIVKSRGYIGFEYYEGKFTHKNELWSYSLTSDLVEQKFIYYYLLTQAYHLHELARGKSVKLPQLAVKDTDELLVPVPSLEEQQRIVDILDRFDALTSSLSEGLPAELAARRSQYEYYRDQLLTFPRKGENQ